jgi:hypothetical protein
MTANNIYSKIQSISWLCIYIVVSYLLGILLCHTILLDYSISTETIQWTFASFIQAFVALLGLIGLIVAFKIQHIRDQIRDHQNAILEYSKTVLRWIFAGFDIKQIEAIKDWLFEKQLDIYNKMGESEDKKANLEALTPEKKHFNQMIEGYKKLEIEREEIYDKLFCPFYLILGIIFVSIIGLFISDELWQYPSFVLGTIILVIWSVFFIGQFLITMMLRERKYEINIAVNVEDKT